MSLTEIEYGALASSKVLNDNFNYLDSEIAAMSENIEQRVSTFSSQVATLNLSVTNLLSFKSSFIAVGMILPYPSLSIPEGFLSCDGSELLISDFEDLYDVIGKRLKIYFTSQTGVKPPKFTFRVNDKTLVHFSYERYLENKIRENFDFVGTPITLQFKNRRDDD